MVVGCRLSLQEKKIKNYEFLGKKELYRIRYLGTREYNALNPYLLP